MAMQTGSGVHLAAALFAVTMGASPALVGCGLDTVGLGPVVSGDPDGGLTMRTGPGDPDGAVPDHDAGTGLDASPRGDATTAADADGALDAALADGEGPPEATPCVTQFGGALLFAFDQGDVTGWVAQVNQDDNGSGLSATASGSTTAGHTCPGALVLTSSFSAYASETEVYFLFQPPTTWTQGKLHVWVQLAIPAGNAATAFEALDAVQPYIQWNDFNDGNYSGWTVVEPGLADGAWHEIVLDLDGSGQNETVQKLAVQIATQSDPPGNGPNAPSPTVVYVDDVWLE